MTAIRRVVLLGFMGSGKSTVAPLLAAGLGWDWIDLDREIERLAGRSVAEIFADSGEPGFRALEAERTAELAGCENTVIAPGGGWVTGQGNLERLGPGTCSVWLEVSATEALARVGSDRRRRPLLDGPEPLRSALRLLEEREPLYRRADLRVPTGSRTPAAIARSIEDLLTARGVALRPA